MREKKVLNITIDGDLHFLLRKESFETEVPMTHIVEDFLRERYKEEYEAIEQNALEDN